MEPKADTWGQWGHASHATSETAHCTQSRRLAVYLESNRAGRTMAHVAELPGCIVRAADAERALAAVPLAIERHAAWQTAHTGASLADAANSALDPVVRVEGGAASGSGSRVALLPGDLAPLDAAELRAHLEWMRWSRSDLLEMIQELIAAQSPDMLAPRSLRGMRSLREILQHIAAAEQWYLTRLFSIPRFASQPNPLDRLRLVREMAYQVLDASDLRADAELREKGGEQWTLRKVLRRFLEHEREHQLELLWRLHGEGLAFFPAWMPTSLRERELHLAGVFAG